MYRKANPREYNQFNKTRCCPGGLNCCGNHFGTKRTGCKPLTRRYIRRVSKHRFIIQLQQEFLHEMN